MMDDVCKMVLLLGLVLDYTYLNKNGQKQHEGPKTSSLNFYLSVRNTAEEKSDAYVR